MISQQLNSDDLDPGDIPQKLEGNICIRAGDSKDNRTRVYTLDEEWIADYFRELGIYKNWAKGDSNSGFTEFGALDYLDGFRSKMEGLYGSENRGSGKYNIELDEALGLNHLKRTITIPDITDLKTNEPFSSINEFLAENSLPDPDSTSIEGAGVYEPHDRDEVYRLELDDERYLEVWQA